MKGARTDGMYLLFLGVVIFVLLGIRTTDLGARSSMKDFEAIYYPARCLMHHVDPYAPNNVWSRYQAEGVEESYVKQSLRPGIELCSYPPSALLLATPLAALSWKAAHLCWVFFIATTFILAACLIWSVAADSAPILSGWLFALALADGFQSISVGNSGSIVVSFCAIAVWCFVRARYEAVGVVCLALALAIKPHVVAFVWLYFLLAGGTYRKRAFQTLAVALAFAIPSALWVSSVAPHWTEELRSNIAVASSGRDYPGPAPLANRTAGMIIDLQTDISIFRNDPHFYNPLTYLICGIPVLIWSLKTLRVFPSPANVWLALAPIVPLAMLPTYHRVYDAKLLLLAIPACAILWEEGGSIRWVALAVTTAGILSTGDIPLVVFVEFTKTLRLPDGAVGKVLTVLLTRPVPLVLLAVSAFYLWVYCKRAIQGPQSTAVFGTETTLPVPTQS
jgi:hypothetical protein